MKSESSGETTPRPSAENVPVWKGMFVSKNLLQSFLETTQAVLEVKALMLAKNHMVLLIII